MQSRSGRARGDAEELGDLHEGQPEVVVQDEDRALLDGQASERPLGLVAVGDDGARVRCRWLGRRHDPDLRCPGTRPPRLVVAGMHEDAMDPRLEALRIPQLRDLAPGEDEGVLQRVLGEARVAQDALRDGVERVTDLVHQDGERLAVAAPSLFDEDPIHLDPPVAATPWPRTTHYDGQPVDERSWAPSRTIRDIPSPYSTGDGPTVAIRRGRGARTRRRSDRW